MRENEDTVYKPCPQIKRNMASLVPSHEIGIFYGVLRPSFRVIAM